MPEIRFKVEREITGKVTHVSKVAGLPTKDVYSLLLSDLVRSLSVDQLVGIVIVVEKGEEVGYSLYTSPRVGRGR